jgi:CHAD domain-containing protein
MVFVTETKSGAATLASELATHLNLDVVEQEKHGLLLADSFDHRLHRAGYALAFDAGRNRVARLRVLGAAEAIATRPYDGDLPAWFAEDLPKGRIRDIASPLIEMRAVLPQVGARVDRTSLAQINKHGKVEARLVVEGIRVWRIHSGENDGRPRRRPLPVRVRVVALRGYERVAEKLAKRLGQMDLLNPASSDWILDAYSTAGAPLGCYRSRPRVEVDDHERADVAVKRALLAIHSIMVENMPGLLKDLDSEFLHDFRVAVRRSRAVLRLVKGVLPTSQVEYFARELRHLGQLTSGPRDSDVLMLKIDDYLEGVSGFEPGSLTVLKDHLQQERDTSQIPLASALQSKRFRTFQRRWVHFLEKGVPARPSAARARDPIGAVVRRETWRAYGRVRKRGDAISPQSPADDLHDLRKACKRLRYLLGLFHELHPPSQVRRVIRDLKILQEVLGTFQDLEAHALMIAQRGDDLRANPKAPTDTLLVMGSLVDLLHAEQHRVRSQFAKAYARFCRPAKDARMSRLCHVKSPQTQSRSEGK